MMRFGSNYVGYIKANAWGTSFEVYDDGLEEDLWMSLPKYLCSQRTKIVRHYRKLR